MGKRSAFDRIERDFYPTPMAAVVPLIPHLAPNTQFCEPCAGDGRLIAWLESWGHMCKDACDIEPMADGIHQADAMTYKADGFSCYITNPPWDRKALHPIIENLCKQKPTWLLFDADWMHTKQSAQFMPWVRKIVSVGRIKWIEDSPHTGKDNCCWYLFDANSKGPAILVGRESSEGG